MIDRRSKRRAQKSKSTKKELLAEIERLRGEVNAQKAELDRQEHDFQCNISRAERDIRYQDLVPYVQSHVGIDAIAEALFEAGPPSTIMDEDHQMVMTIILQLRRLAYLMLLGAK
jgi:hypothetical protein